MIPTIEQFIPQQELFEVLLRDGALNAAELGARLGVSESVAWSWADVGVQACYLDRDEFGRFAPWCAWPRVGL